NVTLGHPRGVTFVVPRARKSRPCPSSRRSPIVAYKPTWRDIFRSTSTKKEKRTKKERKPVESAAAVEIDKGGLRRLLLDDFHKPLENASAFSQFQQARLLGITILRLRRRKLKRKRHLHKTPDRSRTRSAELSVVPQNFPIFCRKSKSSAENPKV